MEPRNSCNCNRDEEDSEELEAWRARRGAEEVLEIGPKLSKEDTVRLLTAQYDQALKQACYDSLVFVVAYVGRHFYFESCLRRAYFQFHTSHKSLRSV